MPHDLRGVFILPNTPYTSSGALDIVSLVRETRYLLAAGVQGIIWPPANDALKYLTREEIHQGWCAIADQARELQLRF